MLIQLHDYVIIHYVFYVYNYYLITRINYPLYVIRAVYSQEGRTTLFHRSKANMKNFRGVRMYNSYSDSLLYKCLMCAAH